ncbi:DUF5071 domain-containing protein [Paenibacillaceae bacterium]|nr:DUF5071 domain-containing protein [Paenibacillaceae bacterium]
MKAMDILGLIPTHKSDFQNVEKLKGLDIKLVKPIIPELLEWLQDMNWPIANDIEDLLINFQKDLVPYIRNVLNTKDGTWKYFLLHGLVKRLPDNILLILKPDLERMYINPTDDEKYEELDDILQELLTRVTRI